MYGTQALRDPVDSRHVYAVATASKHDEERRAKAKHDCRLPFLRKITLETMSISFNSLDDCKLHNTVKLSENTLKSRLHDTT